MNIYSSSYYIVNTKQIKFNEECSVYSRVCIEIAGFSSLSINCKIILGKKYMVIII